MAVDGVMRNLGNFQRAPIQGVMDGPMVGQRRLSALLFLMGAWLLITGAVTLKSRASPWAPKLMVGVGAGLMVVSPCCFRAAQPRFEQRLGDIPRQALPLTDPERGELMHRLRTDFGDWAVQGYEAVARLRWPAIDPATCRRELAFEIAHPVVRTEAIFTYGVRLAALYKEAWRSDAEACVHFLRDVADIHDGRAYLDDAGGMSVIRSAWHTLTDGSPTAVVRDLTGRYPGRIPGQAWPGARFNESNQEAARRVALFLAIQLHPEWQHIENAGLGVLMRSWAVVRVGEILVLVSDGPTRERAIAQLVEWARQLPHPDRAIHAVVQGAISARSSPDGLHPIDYPTQRLRLAQIMAELVRRTTGGVQASMRQRVFEELQSWARSAKARPERRGRTTDRIGPCRVAVAQTDLLGILERAGLDRASLALLHPLRPVTPDGPAG